MGGKSDNKGVSKTKRGLRCPRQRSVSGAGADLVR